MKVKLPFFFCLLLWLPLPILGGVPSVENPWLAQGNELLRQSRYSEAEGVFRNWIQQEPNSPDAHYYLALSLALQARLEEALSGFRQVLSLDPRRADACFEIAAIFLEMQRPEEGFHWARQGLAMDPASQYGLELAGSLSFVLDSKYEALGYWNRINRPHLTSMDILAPDSLDRYSVAEEIDLEPGDRLSKAELEKASWRLAQHGQIRSFEFDPIPGSNPDEYRLEVRVSARSGFGTPGEFLGGLFGQSAFQTSRVTYWDFLGSGTNLEVPVRWNPRARWLRLSLDSARPAHLPIYGAASYSWRDETWNLGSGNAFRFRTHRVGTSFLFPLFLPRLSARFQIGYRWRIFSGDSGIVDPNFAQDSRGAFFVGMNPSLNLLNRDSPLGWKLRSDLRSEIQAIQSRNPANGVALRTTLTWENRLESRSSTGLIQSLELGLHGGWISRQSLLEDRFSLGVGPDSDFSLRAHNIFRDGQKGRSPVAGRFALANLSWRREVRRIGLLRLGVVAFTDIAKIGRPLAGQTAFGTLIDTGAGVELGWGPLRATRLTLAYGRDWKGDRNTVYVGTRFP